MAKIRKTEWVIIRMSIFDKENVRKEAETKGLTVSQYIRRKLGFKN